MPCVARNRFHCDAYVARVLPASAAAAAEATRVRATSSSAASGASAARRGYRPDRVPMSFLLRPVRVGIVEACRRTASQPRTTVVDPVSNSRRTKSNG